MDNLRLLSYCHTGWLDIYSHWLSSRIKDQSHWLTGVIHTGWGAGGSRTSHTGWLDIYSHWLSNRIKDQSHWLTGITHTGWVAGGTTESVNASAANMVFVLIKVSRSKQIPCLRAHDAISKQLLWKTFHLVRLGTQAAWPVSAHQ